MKSFTFDIVSSCQINSKFIIFVLKWQTSSQIGESFAKNSQNEWKTTFISKDFFDFKFCILHFVSCIHNLNIFLKMRRRRRRRSIFLSIWKLHISLSIKLLHSILGPFLALDTWLSLCFGFHWRYGVLKWSHKCHFECKFFAEFLPLLHLPYCQCLPLTFIRVNYVLRNNYS